MDRKDYTTDVDEFLGGYGTAAELLAPNLPAMTLIGVTRLGVPRAQGWDRGYCRSVTSKMEAASAKGPYVCPIRGAGTRREALPEPSGGTSGR
jgi:hypothetical protein